jgi:signal recognition particle subunit SRP54
MKAITGVPIKFMGHGEKTSDLDVFHPDRMAQRILGMGDVVSLVEKAQEAFDEKESAKFDEQMRAGKFDFEMMLGQMRQVKKLGSLGGLMKMMPGGHNLNLGEKEEKKMKQTEAIILSMTLKERRNPDLLNGSRRLRIAKGSGVPASEVNAVIKQFNGMREMMDMLKGGMNSGKGKEMMRQMQAMQRSGGMPGLPGGGGMPGLGGPGAGMRGGIPKGGMPGFGGPRKGFR